MIKHRGMRLSVERCWYVVVIVVVVVAVGVYGLALCDYYYCCTAAVVDT